MNTQNRRLRSVQPLVLLDYTLRGFLLIAFTLATFGCKPGVDRKNQNTQDLLVTVTRMKAEVKSFEFHRLHVETVRAEDFEATGRVDGSRRFMQLLEETLRDPQRAAKGGSWIVDAEIERNESLQIGELYGLNH